MANSAANPQQHDSFNIRSSLNVLYLLLSGHATCLTVFLRRGFGVEALGINGVMAFTMILLYAAATQDAFVAIFFWAWLVALIAQRIETYRLVRRGRIEHSRYDGWPSVAMLLPFVKTEFAAKNVIEPAICLFGGALLCPVSEALGGFVLLGFFSLALKRGLENQVNRMRVQRLRDAEIEQRQLAEWFRGQRNNF